MTASAGGIRAGRAYVELGADTSRMEAGLRQAAARVKAFGDGIRIAGTAVARVGLGIGGAFVPAVHAFANFEQAMARVKAITRETGATDADLAKLTAEAKRLGLETTFSARQAAETMAVFAASGIRARDIMFAIAPALDAAASSQLDLAETARIGMGAMHAMQLGTRDLTRIFDVMALASVTASTDLHDLGKAFEYIGPLAQFTGVRLEELVAMLQVLADNQVRGSMAGTTLRGMLAALNAPSKQARDAMAALRLEVADDQGNFRGFIPVIQDLAKALEGMGSSEQVAALKAIFPQRPLAGVTALLGAADQIPKRMQALERARGANARIAATQLDTLRGSAILLTSSIEGLGIAIGGTLAPILRGFAEGLTIVTNAVARWSDQNPILYRSLALGAGGALALGSSMVVLGGSIRLASVALGGLLIPLNLARGAISLTVGLASSAASALRLIGSGAYVAGRLVLAGIQIPLMLASTAAGVAAVAFSVTAAGVRGLGLAAMAAGKMVAVASGVFTVASVGLTGALAAAKAGFIALVGAISLPAVAMTALGAAIVAVGVNLVSTKDLVGRGVTAMKEGFTSLVGTTVQAWGGIQDAIKANDLGAALQVAMAALNLEWSKGVLAMKGTWLEFVEWLKNDSLKDLGSAIGNEAQRGIALNPKHKQQVAADMAAGAAAAGPIGGAIGAARSLFQIWQSEETTTPKGEAEAAAAAKAQGDFMGPKDPLAAERRKQRQAQSAFDEALASAELKKDMEALRVGGMPLLKGVAGHFGLFSGAVQKKVATLPGLDEVGQAMSKVDVQGTFNARAAGQLGAGKSVAEDIKAEVKESNKHLRDIVRGMGRGGQFDA